MYPPSRGPLQLDNPQQIHFSQLGMTHLPENSFYLNHHYPIFSSDTLSLKRNATFLHGFFLEPMVTVMWPGVMRNLHNPYSLVYTLHQKKGNLKKVASLLRLSVYCKNHFFNIITNDTSHVWSKVSEKLGCFFWDLRPCPYSGICDILGTENFHRMSPGEGLYNI